MMKRAQQSLWTVFLCAVALLAASVVSADGERGAIARLNAGAAALEWLPQGEHPRMVLTVSGPEGQNIRQEFAAGKVPTLSLFDAAGQRLPEGSYTWELRTVPSVDPQVRARLAEARRTGNQAIIAELKAAGKLPEGRVQSGSFAIQSGAFVTAGLTEGEGRPRNQAAASTGGVRNITAEDQVIPDDLIVQQSLCVGFDCVNNESFGFDTIRLKENNTRIKFEDTSTGTFPTNDWQLTANDSASGGSSKFSIEDITGAKVPFTITAGASTNSIFVDSTGRVGFRTSTPVLDLHVATSNTPAIRLEQNNSGGFTAQTWDIAGNEANFFVRDVTGGSRLPFRIRPGAPTSSIDISADGDVGIGIASPAEKLHVFSNQDANKGAEIENSSTGTGANAFIRTQADVATVSFQSHSSTRTISRFGKTLGGFNEMLATTGNGLILGTNNATPLVLGTNAANRLEIASTGAVTISGNLTVNGTFSNPSSRALKEDFEPVDASAVLKKFASLPISEWSYTNDERKLRHVGPTVEDFRSAFGLGTEGQYIFPLDVQGVTMAAVQGLYQLVLEKDAQIAELQKRLDTELSEIKKLLESSNGQP